VPPPWRRDAGAAPSVFDEHARGDAGGSCDIRGAAFGDRKPRAPAEKRVREGAAKPAPAGFSIGVTIAT